MIGMIPRNTPIMVASLSPNPLLTSSISIPSIGRIPSVVVDEVRGKQLMKVVKARACEGREKGSPEE
jgi:hypothetical protein